jgi:two-component system, LuxR family, response regulator FixJ
MATGRTVHVIDDDAAIRDSLSFLLNAAGLEVRTYDSAGAFLSALPRGAVGCIVTDVSMPEMSGVDLLRRLRDMKVDLPVIVITGHGDIQLAVEAMKLGARDFIEKPIDDEALLDSIGSALDAGQKRAEEDAERVALRKSISSLTDRERDVLDGLIAGKPNKIIAFDLGISARTVEIYRANVMTKMNAGSLAELVRMALIAGLLSAQPHRPPV